MITKNLNLKRRSTHCVLSFILQRCRFENSNVVKIEQTYIAQETLYSRQTVSTELKYLQEQDYITYKRSLYNNLTTTEITLTDKSITILNAEASKPQNKPIKTEETQPQTDVPKTENKPSNKPVNTEPRQPQAEAEKTPQQAPKQAKTEQPQKVHDSETEQTEVIITDVQRGCLIALERAVKRGGTYPEIYVEDALQQGVPQELINNILKKRYSDEI